MYLGVSSAQNVYYVRMLYYIKMYRSSALVPNRTRYRRTVHLITPKAPRIQNPAGPNSKTFKMNRVYANYIHYFILQKGITNISFT